MSSHCFIPRNQLFPVRTAQCVSCLLTKPVVRYDDPVTEDAPALRVIAFLVASGGLAYCAACVAFASDVALADAKRVIGSLPTIEPYLKGKGSCIACGRWQATIGFVGNGAASR